MRSLSDYSNKRATQGPKDHSYTDALHRRSIETRYRERWVQHWLFVHFLFCKVTHLAIETIDTQRVETRPGLTCVAFVTMPANPTHTVEWRKRRIEQQERETMQRWQRERDFCLFSNYFDTHDKLVFMPIINRSSKELTVFVFGSVFPVDDVFQFSFVIE